MALKRIEWETNSLLTWQFSSNLENNFPEHYIAWDSLIKESWWIIGENSTGLFCVRFNIRHCVVLYVRHPVYPSELFVYCLQIQSSISQSRDTCLTQDARQCSNAGQIRSDQVKIYVKSLSSAHVKSWDIYQRSAMRYSMTINMIPACVCVCVCVCACTENCINIQISMTVCLFTPLADAHGRSRIQHGLGNILVCKTASTHLQHQDVRASVRVNRSENDYTAKYTPSLHLYIRSNKTKKRPLRFCRTAYTHLHNQEMWGSVRVNRSEHDYTAKYHRVCIRTWGQTKQKNAPYVFARRLTLICTIEKCEQVCV